MNQISFTTIDEYLELQPEKVRVKLQKIRETIEKAVPDAKEVISYQMPAFKYYGMLAFFAAFKDHYSIFVSPPVLNAFKPNLKKYKLSKSGIKILYSEPVPVRLISAIAKFAAARNLAKDKLKKASGKK